MRDIGSRKMPKRKNSKESNKNEKAVLETPKIPLRPPEKMGHFFRYNRSSIISPESGGTISKNQDFASFSNIGQQEEIRYYVQYKLKEGLSLRSAEHAEVYGHDVDWTKEVKARTKRAVASSLLKTLIPINDPILAH